MPRSRPPQDVPDRQAGPRKALDALLAGPAGDPVRRAAMIDALDRRLRPLLPPPLPAHARLANVHEGRLVFLVDAPVWHARLRLATPQLIDAARSIGLPVTEVRVRTATRPLPAPVRPPPPSPASASTRAALAEALALLRTSDDTPKDAPRR